MKHVFAACVFTVLAACAMDDASTAEHGDLGDETLGEISSEISVKKNNVVARSGGLCLWRSGYCFKMHECDVVWVERVNWDTGRAYVYHYNTGWWGWADKDYLTAGTYYYNGGTYWCRANN